MLWIKKNHILIAFVSAHVLFFIMSLLLANMQLATGYEIFDLKMFGGYDLSYVFDFKYQLSERSLNQYLFIQIPLDMIYPILIAYFFFTYIKMQNIFRYIAYLSLLSLVFDYLENISVIYMLTHSNLTNQMVSFASLMTQLKGIMYIFNYSICVIITIIWLTKRIKVQL